MFLSMNCYFIKCLIKDEYFTENVLNMHRQCQFDSAIRALLIRSQVESKHTKSCRYSIFPAFIIALSFELQPEKNLYFEMNDATETLKL